jgi:FAD/FMN-containing dehydrogenase
MTKTDIDELTGLISGDVETDATTREEYSHDTSLFEIVPEAVVFPKDTADITRLIEWANKRKVDLPNLSLTARSGGTDMSCFAINDSIIVVFDRYMNLIGAVEADSIWTEPGAYYRDFDAKTIADSDQIMPAYPASRELCAVGGMVANNAGGEKSLVYGKVENFVNQLKVILRDGNEYEFGPLNRQQLAVKLNQDDFEGEIYRQIHQLLDGNYQQIMAAKPNVTKNSTGYKLWDVWDKDTGTFDLSQLMIGSQGTLGLVSDINYRLVPRPKHSGVLSGYARDLDHLGELIEVLLEHNPTAIEAFDKHTLKFAFRFFLKFRKSLGWWGLIRLAISLIPDAFVLLLGTPDLIFIASYDGDSQDEINTKLETLKKDLDVKNWHMTTLLAETEHEADRYWLMRRKSFALLRDNVKGDLHTAPFIDDIVVPPDELTNLWPKLIEILEKYDFLYTIAGHLGDGNFHIIPLMDLSDEHERAKIEPALLEVIKLVKLHSGVISGEHNDGLIRSPFLANIYGDEVFELFKRTKQIFDPDNIFNPHKKTDADWQYSKSKIRSKF